MQRSRAINLLGLLLVACLTLFAIQVRGQYEPTFGYRESNGAFTARYFPSTLNLKKANFQISAGFHFWLDNNRLSYGQLYDFYKSDQIGDNQIQQLLGNMKGRNQFGVGQDFQIVGLAWQWKRESQANIHFSFGIHDDLSLDLTYNKDLLKLLWEGNAQFAGQTLKITPLNLNLQYLREYALGMAMPLKGGKSKNGWRFGVRAAFIQGMAGVKMPSSNRVTLFTQPQGRYLEFDFDYRLKTSGLNNFSLTQFKGYGVGFNAGLTKYFKDRWQFRLSLNDWGFVKFNRQTRHYFKDRTIRYEGLFVDNLLGGNPRFRNVDSFSNIFLPEKVNGNGFRSNLPTKISLQSGYELANGLANRPASIWFTLIKGLNNQPGASQALYANAGYRTEAFKNFHLTTNAAVGGYGTYAMGLAAEYQLGKHWQFYAGTQNLLPILNKDWGSGIAYTGVINYRW